MSTFILSLLPAVCSKRFAASWKKRSLSHYYIVGCEKYVKQSLIVNKGDKEVTKDYPLDYCLFLPCLNALQKGFCGCAYYQISKCKVIHEQ